MQFDWKKQYCTHHNLIYWISIPLSEVAWKGRQARESFFTLANSSKCLLINALTKAPFPCNLKMNSTCLYSTVSLTSGTIPIKVVLDGDVPRSTSYGVYTSQLIRFARASSQVADFSTRNKLLTQKLLKQGYRHHKLCKTFSKFYRRYYDLISKFQIGLKSLLGQGLSEPVHKNNFPLQKDWL